MKYFSLFSGIGGFELGIQQAYAILNNRPTGEEKQTCEVDKNCSNTSCEHSWEPPTCIGFSEIDKYAIATYQSHLFHFQTSLFVKSCLTYMNCIHYHYFQTSFHEVNCFVPSSP